MVDGSTVPKTHHCKFFRIIQVIRGIAWVLLRPVAPSSMSLNPTNHRHQISYIQGSYLPFARSVYSHTFNHHEGPCTWVMLAYCCDMFKLAHVYLAQLAWLGDPSPKLSLAKATLSMDRRALQPKAKNWLQMKVSLSCIIHLTFKSKHVFPQSSLSSQSQQTPIHIFI